MGLGKTTVRVFAKPNCTACEAAKRRLNNRHIALEVNGITT
jgi:arsenate reductase-like glutaredoxin family protein